MYNFDVYNFFIRLVPWFLRKPVFLGFLKVLASGIQYVVDALAVFQENTQYYFYFNSQVCYLEQVLNETFPDGDSEIYIETLFLSPVFFYNKIEERPAIYLYNKIEDETPFYLRNRIENFGVGQFIVWVPEALAGQELQIAALVDQYNIIGINYTIQIIP